MKRTAASSAAAVVLLVAVGLGALLVGPVSLSPGGVFKSIIDRSPFVDVSSSLTPIQTSIVWELRAPRIVLAILVGGALSIAGASFQAVFRNPLADPYLLGAAAGAGVGATLAIVYLDSGPLLAPLAFVGALAGVAIAYVAGSVADPTHNPASVLLAGVATASFFTAVQTYVQQQHAQTLPQVYSWILGHLSTAGWGNVRSALPYVILSCTVLIAVAGRLDALSVGDDKARSVGVDVRRLRVCVIVAASLATAAAVAVSGLIGFVGLVVPHIVRLVVGHENRLVVPIAFVAGGIFLVSTDVVARTALAPAELPIGVVTAFIGAPFFIAVLWRSARGVG